MIRLATVSPCYNEEAVLRHSTERLTELFNRMMADGLISQDSMMVFVNDGSRDRTWEIISELHTENKLVRGINMSRNVGHQNAIMAGMMTARGWVDAVITIDADLQDDIECIPQMVKRFEEGYDIVYGVNHADFRLMSRRALDMLSTYEEHNLYLRGLIPMLGLPSTTVDDVISERFAGSSKYTLSKMLHLAMAGITAFSVRPMHAIFHIGMTFLIIAFGIGVYVAYSIIAGTAVLGWASLILSIWLVGGFIIFSIGIAGMYIGNIYNEVKHRPRYHIQDILLCTVQKFFFLPPKQSRRHPLRGAGFPFRRG